MELNYVFYEIKGNEIDYISYNISNSEKDDKNKIKKELKDSMNYLSQAIESIYGTDYEKKVTNNVNRDNIETKLNYEFKSEEIKNPLTTSLKYEIKNKLNKLEKVELNIVIRGNREELITYIHDTVKKIPELTMSEIAKTNINSLDFILKGEYKKNDFGLLELI